MTMTFPPPFLFPLEEKETAVDGERKSRFVVI
jgi:hypothetical protein